MEPGYTLSTKSHVNFSCRFEQTRIEYFFQHLPKLDEYEVRTVEVIPRTNHFTTEKPQSVLPLVVREPLQVPREIVPFSKRQAGM